MHRRLSTLHSLKSGIHLYCTMVHFLYGGERAIELCSIKSIVFFGALHYTIIHTTIQNATIHYKLYFTIYIYIMLMNYIKKQYITSAPILDDQTL